MADDELDLYLRGQYIEAGDRNAVNNSNRDAYLHRSNRALILSLCALVMCAVPHVIAVRNAKPEPQQIQIVSGSTQMPDREKTPPIPAPPAVVPPKPVPPPNIDIRPGMKLPSTYPGFDLQKK